MSLSNPTYFIKPSPLKDAVQDFFSILSAYPKTFALFNQTKWERRIFKKYSDPFLVPPEPFNFFTAVLDSNLELGKQANSFAFTPEGSLRLIEEMLIKYPFNASHQKGLRDKFYDLNGTSYFDTISELVALKCLYENLDPNLYKVEFEYDFGSSINGGSPKNADLAMVNRQTGEEFLIDVVSPKSILEPGQGAVPPTEDEPPQLLDTDGDHQRFKKSLLNKYNDKFSSYCQQNPNASASVFVSFLKNDHFKIGYQSVVLNNAIEKILDPAITALAGFKYGLAFTVQSADKENLNFLALGEIY